MKNAFVLLFALGVVSVSLAAAPSGKAEHVMKLCKKIMESKTGRAARAAAGAKVAPEMMCAMLMKSAEKAAKEKGRREAMEREIFARAAAAAPAIKETMKQCHDLMKTGARAASPARRGAVKVDRKHCMELMAHIASAMKGKGPKRAIREILSTL